MRFSGIAGILGAVKPFIVERSGDDDEIKDEMDVGCRVDGSAFSLHRNGNARAYFTTADRYTCSGSSSDKYAGTYTEAH
jgi:hypothetical protein